MDERATEAPILPAGEPAVKDALFPRDETRDYPNVVRGAGIHFWDDQGRRYIDGDSGAVSVNSIGHGVAEVGAAMAAQAERLAYIQYLRFHHPPAREYASRLQAIAPMEDARVLLVQTGSDANETAIKLARHYHHVRGNERKHLVVTRKRSYHGATVAALSLSGTPARKEPYLPLLPFQPRLAEQYCYRCPFEKEYPSCGLACADDLTRVIDEVGADQVAAVLVEPIVAAGGPGLTPPPGYLERLQELCRENDILLMVDEVVTGLGRTGKMFGVEHWGIEPDVLTMAKGMAGGYAPLGGLLVGPKVVSAFTDRGQAFSHGFTYDAHPVACAAGMAVLDIIERDDLPGNARRQGERLFAGASKLAEKHPMIGDIRGLGLLCGFELVADRETRRPFDPELGVTKKICTAAEENGLMIYPGVGADGVAGDVFLISPPLVITAEEVDDALERLDRALTTVETQIAQLV